MNSQTILQLKRQIETETLWAVRHHLNLSSRCPFRVAWLYPLGSGSTADSWMFKRVGGGLPLIELATGDYCIANDAAPKLQVRTSKAMFASTWLPQRQRYGGIRMIARPMPRLITPFTLQGGNNELHGIIYSSFAMEPSQQGAGLSAA